jgi:hypothetical protein
MLLDVTDGFISPQKKGEVRIFIALKNLSLLVWFEPANLGSNGKYANHYIIEETS